MSRINRKHKNILKLEASGVRIGQLNDKTLTFKSNAAKCLWNAFIVFLFMIGICGMLIFAFSLPCNMPLLILFTAAASLFFSLFNLRMMLFYIGYIILFVFVLLYFDHANEYINSGLNAVFNNITQAAGTEFSLDSVMHYTETVENRAASVTAFFVLVITVLTCILNDWASRRLSIIYPLIFLILPAVEFCIYLNDEFSYAYLAIILLAILLYELTRRNDEMPADSRKHQKSYFAFRKKIYLKDRRVAKKYNLLSSALMLAIVLAVTAISFFFVSDNFVQSNSELKKKTDKYVIGAAKYGISSFFEKNRSGNGGIKNGSLGDVSSVSFDYRTDIELTLVPYSSQPLYIPLFTANRYSSSNKKWFNYNDTAYFLDSNGELRDKFEDYSRIYDYLKKNFNQDDKLDAEQKQSDNAPGESVFIKNVDAGNKDDAYGKTLSVHMYYSLNHMQYIIERTVKQGSALFLKYCPPSFTDDDLKEISQEYQDNGKASLNEQNFENSYLQVPEEIADEIRQICSEQDFGGTEYEVIQQIKAYLSSEFTYTLSPGKTPSDKDFVLYFLKEHKEGYCVHFASAACILLRQMGIPARYVEGYCFDDFSYEDMTLYNYDEDGDDAEIIFPSSYSKKIIRQTPYAYFENDFLVKESDLRKSIEKNGDFLWQISNFEERLEYDKPVTVKLTDENAHAWVEVYLGGLGWIPVEFTVGRDKETDNEEFLSVLGTASPKIQNKGSEFFIRFFETFANIISYGIGRLLILAITAALIIIAAAKARTMYALYYCEENKRAVNQYRYITKLVKNHLKNADEIITHSELRVILSEKYGISRSFADEAVTEYEKFIYSEDGESIAIGQLNSVFCELSERITDKLEFIRRLSYKMLLFKLTKT